MSAPPSSPSSSRSCELCSINPSKYCCPRCEVYYCSLDCYKSEKHMSCSETFYRDCVNDELASLSSDSLSKQKMIDILKKIKTEGPEDFGLDYIIDDEDDAVEDVDSDDEIFDLEDRVKGIDLDNADAVWNILTDDEKNEFEAIVSHGDVESIVPRWEPWWTYNKDARYVEEVDNKEEEEALKKCPKFIEVPEFSTLTNVEPSPTIRYNITNVLASYAFVIRYFNDELDPVEGATYLLNICANLDTNTNFEKPATAVESVKQKCLQSQLIQTDDSCAEIMKRDTFFLLQGPSEENKMHYCRAALSHLHTILSQARSALKLIKPSEKLLKPAGNLPKLDEKPANLPISNEKPTKLPPLEEKPETKTKVENQGAFSKKFPDHKGDHLPKLDLSKLKKCIKKVEFYLSFVESCGMDFE